MARPQSSIRIVVVDLRMGEGSICRSAGARFYGFRLIQVVDDVPSRQAGCTRWQSSRNPLAIPVAFRRISTHQVIRPAVRAYPTSEIRRRFPDHLRVVRHVLPVPCPTDKGKQARPETRFLGSPTPHHLLWRKRPPGAHPQVLALAWTPCFGRVTEASCCSHRRSIGSG